jgi:hypothetical protein
MQIPRQWLMISKRNSGKSTFGAMMNPEYLVLDFDGRWPEQAKRAGGKSHIIQEATPLAAIRKMNELRTHLYGSVGKVIFDSGTSVLDYMQAYGRLEADEAFRNKTKFNKDEINRMKADTMRTLRLAALQWHCDYLWIFHIEENMKSGRAGERVTISKTEMERMKQNLNAVLTIVQDEKGMRGVRVEWSRYNLVGKSDTGPASGQIIWDFDGLWKGVPEKLDEFLVNYQGTEGYNGNQYSGAWLLEYLQGKGKEFADVETLYKAIDMKEEPWWFDRNGWGKYIKKVLG